MSGYPVPTEPPPDFQLTKTTIEAARVLERLLDRDHDDVPEWVRKAAAGVDPQASVPSDRSGDPGEPPGGAGDPLIDIDPDEGRQAYQWCLEIRGSLVDLMRSDRSLTGKYLLFITDDGPLPIEETIELAHQYLTPRDARRLEEALIWFMQRPVHYDVLKADAERAVMLVARGKEWSADNRAAANRALANTRDLAQHRLASELGARAVSAIEAGQASQE